MSTFTYTVRHADGTATTHYGKVKVVGADSRAPAPSTTKDDGRKIVTQQGLETAAVRSPRQASALPR